MRDKQVYALIVGLMIGVIIIQVFEGDLISAGAIFIALVPLLQDLRSDKSSEDNDEIID